jgi:hypothetical protein
MVAQLYRVQGGRCAHCGSNRDLYVLELVRDEDPRLRPAVDGEIGICLDSWRLVRIAIGYTFARRVLEDDQQ